jgi:hypothetical protein
VHELEDVSVESWEQAQQSQASTASYLNHQRRVWRLVSALWGEVRRLSASLVDVAGLWTAACPPQERNVNNTGAKATGADSQGWDRLEAVSRWLQSTITPVPETALEGTHSALFHHTIRRHLVAACRGLTMIVRTVSRLDIMVRIGFWLQALVAVEICG